MECDKRTLSQFIKVCTPYSIKEPLIFDYNSRISWSIFIILTDGNFYTKKLCNMIYSI